MYLLIHIIDFVTLTAIVVHPVHGSAAHVRLFCFLLCAQQTYVQSLRIILSDTYLRVL